MSVSPTLRIARAMTPIIRVGLFLVTVLGAWLTAPSDGSASTLRLRHPSTARVIRFSVVQQINAIRHKLGLPVAQAMVTFTPVVQRAAQTDSDPSISLVPGMVEEYGVWGIMPAGSDSATASDTANETATLVNEWVYQDGWQGSSTSNLDCTSPSATGCNSHRRAVLSAPPARGARLRVDITVAQTKWLNRVAPVTSVAALFIWQLPSKHG